MIQPVQGSLCRRRKDGQRYEVIWVMRPTYRQPQMVQMRWEGAKNLKNTIWVQLGNFDRLYERLPI